MDFGLLVISDLHLGEDLRPAGASHQAHFDAIASELVAFVRHYTRPTSPTRRWRLVINGDMVDFLTVVVDPEPVTEAPEASVLDAVRPAWDAESQAGTSTRKIQAVIDRNRTFFDALAAFVGHGNDLVIVAGNHDAELVWPEVQEALIEGLVACWAGHPERAEPGVRDEAEVRGAVRVQTWFYYEQGLAWVEHGHQYDAYCSVEHVLDPRDTTEPLELEQNLGSAVMRYIGRHLPGNAEENADLSFVDYLRLANALEGSTKRAVLAGYFWLVAHLFAQWGARLLRPAAHAERARQHEARLRKLAQEQAIPEELMLKLEKLRTTPVFVEWLRLLRALMLGRLLVTVAALGLAPLMLMLLPWAWVPWALGALLVVTVGTHLFLALGRDQVDPRVAMRRSARAIAGILRAPIVVFGHSHVPVVDRIPRGGWYFNTGTWVGGPKAARSFTHLVAERSPRGVRAALCQWREGRSWELRAEEVRTR